MKRDDLIEQFQELSWEYSQAKDNADAIMTRAWYRDNSGIPDSTWMPVFGSWSGFKKAAWMAPDTTSVKLANQVAKHDMHDRYRRFQADEIRPYEDKYNKPTGKRYQTIMVCSDVHDKHADPFSVYLFIETCKRVQPEVIAIGGDLFDFYEFSKYAQDPREFDLIGRIDWVHNEFLTKIREACPDAQIDLIGGNHEERLLKHLCDAQAQPMRVFLSDFHNFTFATLLGLDKYEINFICRQDLAAFNRGDQKKELQNNYKVYFNAFMVNHFPQGINYGLPGCNGHHHTHLVKNRHNLVYGPYEWHQLGCMKERRAVYCQGEKWSNGFLIAHVDTQPKAPLAASVVHEYIQITDHAVIGGRWYRRDEIDN